MNFPKGFKRSAAMVVLRCEQQFLLLKRIRPPFVGNYLPVGGKLDPHEDPYSAALREAYEETGIQLEKLHYGGVLIETSPIDYNWQSNIYVADIEFREPPLSDEGTLEWVDFENVPNIPTPPTDFVIYQYLMQSKPFAFNAIYDAEMQLLSMDEEIEGVRVL
ncbi:MAG: NUDIX domain-containing protein [Saprospiraceae bacterium]|nr:NUDIX domain-containing protein [Saprospiraceae bacterium]